MPYTPLAKTVEQDIESLVEGEEIVVREKVLRGVLHALLELALDSRELDMNLSHDIRNQV